MNEIIQHGFCWSESRNPSIDDAFNQLGEKASPGTFTSTLSDFKASTTLYISAYATTESGTQYGKAKQFTTEAATTPMVSTTAVSTISGYSAGSGGEVSDDGGSPVTARGVCWSRSENPSIGANQHTTDGNGTGSFESSLTGLDCDTKYYVRAYATNTAGTSYGEQLEFTTGECAAGLSVVSTSSITSYTIVQR